MSKAYQIIYVLIAVGISSMVAFHPDYNANLMLKILGILSGTICGYLGFRIGEMIRNFVVPDFYTAPDATSLLFRKIWWSCGIQLLGTFLGCSIGIGLVVKFFNINPL